MIKLKHGRRREAAAEYAPKVKRLELDLFKTGAEVIYGGWLEDGVLRPDLSARYEQWFNGYTPSGVTAAFYSACLNAYYVVQSAAVVVKGADSDYFIHLTSPVTDPFFYEEYDGGAYRVVMRNADEGKLLTAYTSTDFTPDVPLCMAVRHHHRLFGLDGGDGLLIRWSGSSSSLDWSEGINASGYVRLGGSLGKVLGLASLGAAVIIVRERGLTSLTALGAPENFKINDLPLPSSEIVSGTAAVCGGSLYFYTATGIMKFDGDGVTAVEAPFQSGISVPVCAAGRGEKYLLGCGGSVYCYDTEREYGYFIDCPAEVFLNGAALLAFGSGEVHIIDGAEPSVSWRGGDIDFGRVGKKTVTALYIACGGAAETVISNGVAERTFTGSGRFKVGLSGENFTVKITADGDVTAARLYAEAYDDV